MKKIVYLVTLCLFINSCEDVIEVDVPNASPKLVIDASLNWFDGTSGEEQTIKLTLSAPFFDNQVSPATGAIVTVTNANNTIFNFIDDNNDGMYNCNNFTPILDQEYTLNIIYNQETYIGTETLKSIVPFDFIEQNDEGGFLGDEIEIKAFFTDPGNEQNNYFFEIKEESEENPTIDVSNDEFINGNQIFGLYISDDLEVGEQVILKNYGVSSQFYEFMFLLLLQVEDAGGGPFQVQPATVRGNCINTTNPDNFPFGYFRISQATEFTYIVE